MKALRRLIFVVTIAGLLTTLINEGSEAARRGPTRSSYEMELGASPFTPCGVTAALFVLLYGLSAAACIPRTQAIKPTVLLEPEALSA